MLMANDKKYIFYAFIFLTLIGNLADVYADFFHRVESLKAVVGYTEGYLVDDTSLVARLIQAYQNSDHEANKPGNSMWYCFFNERHASIHHIFKNGQFDEATHILRNPASTDLFYGIDTLCNCFLPQFQNQEGCSAFSMCCLDGLIRFAEAIGAVRLYNPESHHIAPAVFEADTVLSLIEQKLGISLVFPNPYPQECGVLTSKGVVSSRVPQALYQAWKIKQLVKDIKNPRVLEIGAGVGRTAYFANLLGIKDYTIIDLPMTALSSGYFLGRSLGENGIILHGEKQEKSKNKVKILVPSDFFNGHKKYDLIINVDSMTEMDPQIAKKYWKKITSSTKTFLSINHDMNSFTVNDLIEESHDVLRVHRSPYWLRNGYIEELIRFK